MFHHFIILSILLGHGDIWLILTMFISFFFAFDNKNKWLPQRLHICVPCSPSRAHLVRSYYFYGPFSTHFDSLFLSHSHQRSAIFFVWFCTFFLTSNQSSDHETSIWQLGDPHFRKSKWWINDWWKNSRSNAKSDDLRVTTSLLRRLFICYVIWKFNSWNEDGGVKQRKRKHPPPSLFCHPSRAATWSTCSFLTTCKSCLVYSRSRLHGRAPRSFRPVHEESEASEYEGMWAISLAQLVD